ncbi:MAG: SIS domain-containing protein [Bryobacterales bacterium]
MSFAADYRTKLVHALETIEAPKVDEVVDLLRQARDEGRRVFICGNGGSASSANHFVCDMVKGASYQRDKRFKIMALSESIPTMTAYANDVGYEEVFVEQLKNFAEPGDVVMAISGSGNSPNVVKAIEYGNTIGCKTIGLTGFSGGKLAKAAQVNIHVADDHMGRCEDGHMIVLHMIGYCFMDEKL